MIALGTQFMNPKLLSLTCCPRCRGSLTCQESEVISGHLQCDHCSSQYEVVKGVPILLTQLTRKEQFTAENFAAQWRKFDEMGGLGAEFEERQFYEYFSPFDTGKLKDKIVLEAGCGYGRNLIQASKCGAQSAIGFDVSDAAFIAKARGCDVVIADILNPPFRQAFDVVFTFGVLQHVSDPDAGLGKLYDLVLPSGYFCHTVYAAENNWFLVHLLTPLRERFFSHMSSRVRYGLSVILGILSYILFLVCYKPFSIARSISAWASNHLFYYDYMILTIDRLGLKQWIGQVYDQLGAPVAAYFPRRAIDRWMSSLQLKDTYVHFRNKNAWNFGGRK